MANSSENVDEALAGMAKVGAPRVPMGTEATSSATFPSADTGNQMLRPRGGAQAGDPTVGPTNHRGNDLMQGGYERMGARYGIRVNTVVPTAPEAGATQANGRIISSSILRSRQSFDEGTETSYI